MKIRIPHYVSLSRMLFIFAFFYLEVISLRLFSIPNLYIVLLFGALICTFIEIQKDFIHSVKSIVIILSLTFLTICYIEVFLVAINRSVGMQSVTRLLEYVTLGVMIYAFSKHDGNLVFISRILLALGIIVCVLMIFSPEIYSEGIMRTIYLSYSSSVNPHVTSMMEVLGIFAILYLFTISDIISFRKIIMSLGGIALMLYAIILTNSRKGFIVAVILLALSLPKHWRLICSEIHAKQRIIIFICLFIILGLAALWVYRSGVLTQNNLWDRLSSLSDDSNVGRLNYIIEGFRVFFENPILGVGLNNFRYYSYAGTYSHCTYAELPACTGIVGTIPFSAMYIVIIKKILNLPKNNTSELCQKRLMMSMVIVLIFISFTQISFYMRELMVMIFTMGVSGEILNLRQKD